MRAERMLVVFFTTLLATAECKHFESRCKLVREMLRTSFKSDLFLGQWVCLAEKESNRNTSLQTVSSSGKRFYGIFQISSRWCREGKRGGDCNITCEALIDDDIRDDAVCAQHIFNLEGFKYWPKWVSRCKGASTLNFYAKEIYKCPDLPTARVSPDRLSPPRGKRHQLPAAYDNMSKTNTFAELFDNTHLKLC